MEPEGEAAGVIDIERIAIGRKKQGEGRQGCLGVEWSLLRWFSFFEGLNV